jgi:hypothetical protein
MAYYGGAVMSNEMHDRFDAKYYCPTAVRCTTLDYLKAGKTIETTILGDPTRAACIINDALGSFGLNRGKFNSFRKSTISHRESLLQLNPRLTFIFFIKPMLLYV